MTSPMPLILPRACVVCRGDILYSGKGRRPTTCSPTCRHALRADDQAAYRDRKLATPPVLLSPTYTSSDDPDADDGPLMGLSTRRASGRLGATTEIDAIHADYLDTSDELPPFDIMRLSRSGDIYASDAKRKPRAADPAARWLAQHHPRELATFPAA